MYPVFGHRNMNSRIGRLFCVCSFVVPTAQIVHSAPILWSAFPYGDFSSFMACLLRTRITCVAYHLAAALPQLASSPAFSFASNSGQVASPMKRITRSSHLPAPFGRFLPRFDGIGRKGSWNQC
jgi:hypothetical protein